MVAKVSKMIFATRRFIRITLSVLCMGGSSNWLINIFPSSSRHWDFCILAFFSLALFQFCMGGLDEVTEKLVVLS
jgi:hypothetical protein